MMKQIILFSKCTDEYYEGRERHVEYGEVRPGPVARVDAADVVEVVKEVVDAVDVAHDDELDEGDEQVGPAGGVVVKKVNQVTAAL